jgi:hypothetical protein
MIRMAGCVAVALALSLAPPAAALSLEDPASGLAITPPDGYVAVPAAGADAAGARAIFDITRDGEQTTACRVSIVEAPINALLSQAELNQRATLPEFQRQIAASLAQSYDLIAVDVVNLGRIVGLAAIGDPARPPGQATAAPLVRAVLIVLDTPLMRVFFTCVAERWAFATRIAEFEKVLDGLSVP